MILASGPSLTQADAEYVRSKARVIAINTSYQMAPWADVLYAADLDWWRTYRPQFAGLKFSVSRRDRTDKWPKDVTVLKAGNERGLSDDPTTLCLGRNSGYQAINLASLLGAAKIVLLGYDMSPSPEGRQYWHRNHPHRKPHDHYLLFRKLMAFIVAPLAAKGVTVLNASRRTALTCFPRVDLERVL